MSSKSPTAHSVVSFGGGVNSTALVVGLHERGERPDVVLFADPGSEFPDTYVFLTVFEMWLKSNMGLDLTRCRAATPGALSHGSLYQECLNNKTLPSLAFGFKGCSVKWKRQAMDSWVAASPLANTGKRIRRLIGIDAGESHRGVIDDDRYDYERPLVDWGWGREECVDAIRRAGLPVPPKSSCWFCPAMKKREVLDLATNHPDLFGKAVAMEDNFLAGPNSGGSVVGLGRHWSWRSLVESDARQRRLFVETQEADCLCFDGEAA